MAQTPGSAGEVTRLLQAWRQGDPEALDNLMPIVYDSLHQMAERHFRRERPGHTLQPTAIVNEVYLRLVGTEGGTWENRAHFFAAAARTMRHILVDHARARQAKKRGGQGADYLLDTTILVEPRAVDLIAVDDGLEELTKLDAEQGRVVELRFFAGLTEVEIAKVLGISEASVYRKWLSAKAFLHRKLAGDDR
jgi:RNA polymerase sigma factor (TIGR02999 family)